MPWWHPCQFLSQLFGELFIIVQSWSVFSLICRLSRSKLSSQLNDNDLNLGLFSVFPFHQGSEHSPQLGGEFRINFLLIVSTWVIEINSPARFRSNFDRGQKDETWWCRRCDKQAAGHCRWVSRSAEDRQWQWPLHQGEEPSPSYTWTDWERRTPWGCQAGPRSSGSLSVRTTWRRPSNWWTPQL